jgi:SEC-C motif domain protein
MSICPCGSGKALEGCCFPYVDGVEDAPTAEALMRSRYVAYSLGQVSYVIWTCHPSILAQQDEAAMERWCKSSEFVKLEVLEVKNGKEKDESGSVKFIAWIRENGKLGGIHERSGFVRYEGRWTYQSGQHFPLKMPGANDACPCGSGKKFKKCCEG